MKEITTDKKNMFSESLSKTLLKLLEINKTNMRQLHKNTGIPFSTINRMINESDHNPTINSLLPIADYFGITLNQLMGIDPLDSDMLIGIYSKKREHWTKVPIIDWEQAFGWHKNPSTENIQETITTDVILNNNPFALVINETNLEGFMPNTVIIVDAITNIEHGDYVVTSKLDQKKSSLKQVLIDDGRVYLRPLNKNFQTHVMDDAYKIIGIVIQIRMDTK